MIISVINDIYFNLIMTVMWKNQVSEDGQVVWFFFLDVQSGVYQAGTHKLDRYTELGVQTADTMTFIYIDKISIQNALNGKFGSSDHSSLTFVWVKKWMKLILCF